MASEEHSHAAPPRLMIDTHLDLAWNAIHWNRDLTEPMAQLRQREAAMTDHRGRGRATVCFPELRRGGFAVVLGTILARAKSEARPATFRRLDLDYGTQDIASAQGQGQLAYYKLMERRHEMRFIKSAATLDTHWRNWQEENSPIGLILAMEGADPIVEPSHAQWWWDQGLRVVSLAHYGHSHYGAGTGAAGGLTEKGIVLLKEFQRLGMILDLTHTSDECFFEELDRFGGRVLASHNNCRAITPGERQYTDDQIKRIVARDGVIGVAFDAWMLYPNWKVGETDRSVVTPEAACNQIDHICQVAGNANHVGIGSDLDGGFGTEQVPDGIETIADLQKLAPILSKRGYTDGQIDAVFHGNWLRFFRSALPAV